MRRGVGLRRHGEPLELGGQALQPVGLHRRGAERQLVLGGVDDPVEEVELAQILDQLRRSFRAVGQHAPQAHLV